MSDNLDNQLDNLHVDDDEYDMEVSAQPEPVEADAVEEPEEGVSEETAKSARLAWKEFFNTVRKLPGDQLAEMLVAQGYMDIEGLLSLVKQQASKVSKRKSVKKSGQHISVKLSFDNFYQQIKASVATADLAKLGGHLIADAKSVERVSHAKDADTLKSELEAVGACIAATNRVQLYVRTYYWATHSPAHLELLYPWPCNARRTRVVCEAQEGCRRHVQDLDRVYHHRQ